MAIHTKRTEEFSPGICTGPPENYLTTWKTHLGSPSKFISTLSLEDLPLTSVIYYHKKPMQQVHGVESFPLTITPPLYRKSEKNDIKDFGYLSICEG